MKKLERQGVLNRELEALPTSRQVRRRLDRGGALTVPELSVLMSWTKIVLADELLASDLPDDPYLDFDLAAYFPQPMQEGFAEQIREHPLRREIIVTQVVNDLVNGAGMTFCAAARGRDRRDGRRADPRQLRGPRDLRVAAAARGAEGLGQQDRRRAADPDADPDADPRRARLPVAGHQPPAAARQPGHRRPLPGAGAGADGAAAGADDRPRARAPARAPRQPRRAGRARGPRDPGGRARPVVLAARHRRDRGARRPRPGGGRPGPLRARRAARPLDGDAADLRAAARGPLADDGAGRDPRRPLRRAHRAHRQGARRQRR